MNLILGLLVVVATASVAIGALLVCRRYAPEDGHFNDGDRAAGVFGVLATGFSVLLGLIVFLAFSSSDQARTGPRPRPCWCPSSSRPRSCSSSRPGQSSP